MIIEVLGIKPGRTDQRATKNIIILCIRSHVFSGLEGNSKHSFLWREGHHDLLDAVPLFLLSQASCAPGAIGFTF